MEKENNYIQYCYALIQGICMASTISVTKSVDERGVLLTVSGISNDDMKNVIGKKGSHIMAIRQLLRVAGALENAKIALKVEEPVGSTYRQAY